MTAPERGKSADPSRLITEEADRRLDSYYGLARPGEADSPIEPMGARDVYFIVVVSAVLVALWLVGRFVVLPMYV